MIQPLYVLCSGRDLNRALLEHKSEALLFEVNSSVIIKQKFKLTFCVTESLYPLKSAVYHAYCQA